MSRRPAPAAAFSADWLQLREPFDAIARDRAARQLGIARQLLAAQRPAGSPLRVIDLACGTGANLRWLAPQLGGHQQWLVVDHDEALLQRWPASLGTPGADTATGRGLLPWRGPACQLLIRRRRLDLAQGLERLPWPAAELVTASALIDLVAAPWLQRLVSLAAGARAALLIAMSVDGRHHFAPGDGDDQAVLALFDAHQRRDKGLGGPALGADAPSTLVAALRARRYRVHSARSDWVLDGRHDAAAQALQHALIDGIAQAAREQQPDAAPMVCAWQQRRQWLAARSVLRVGHRDVLALPPA